MRVHDVRDELLVLADLERRLGQQGVAERVVVVFAPRLVVNPGPAEVPLAVDEPDRHLVIEHRLVHADPLFLAPAHVDARGLHERDPVFCAVDGSIQRHHDPRVVAHFAKRLGQGGDDVGKAADLGVRRALGRHEKYFKAVGRGADRRRMITYPSSCFLIEEVLLVPDLRIMGSLGVPIKDKILRGTK